jgi:hypothetical protein
MDTLVERAKDPVLTLKTAAFLVDFTDRYYTCS